MSFSVHILHVYIIIMSTYIYIYIHIYIYTTFLQKSTIVDVLQGFDPLFDWLCFLPNPIQCRPMYNKHKITMYGYNMHVIFIHSNFREAILSIVKDTSFIPKYYFSYLTKFSVAQCVIYVLFIYSNFRETLLSILLPVLCYIRTKSHSTYSIVILVSLVSILI